MQRRDFIKISGITASLLLMACSSDTEDTMGGMGDGTGSVTQISPTPFTPLRSLAIPPQIEGTNINGVLHFDLSVEEGSHSFFEGTLTQTYGINGNYLGPTLRLKDGDEVSLNFTNNLNEPTTMHSHGMHLPATMDGGVHQIINPSEIYSSTYKVKQKAATNWYHPHLMGTTAEQVYKGLAGFIIIDDSDTLTLDLPKTYGVDDIPLVLQDRFFDANYEFDYSPSRRQIMRGYIGDTFLTNGTINPYLDVQAKELRLRLLNGSNSSVYTLAFNDNHIFKQIATDNSLLESPVNLSAIRLSPGERAEIVVDLTADEDKTLSLIEINQSKSFLQLNVKTATIAPTTTPTTLTSLTKYTLEDASYTRNFTLSGSMGNFYINGVAMDKNVINEVVPIDRVEIWSVTNEMSMNHNFHIHATHFLVVERNGSALNVLSNEKGYKDTVFLSPDDNVKLMVKMSDYSDTTNAYMYHCHFLEHEDAGMMGQFVVV